MNDRGVFLKYNRVLVKGLHSFAQVNPAKNVASATVDLKLLPHPLLSRRQLGPGQRELSGVQVAGRFPSDDKLSPPIRTSRIEVAALMPDEPRPAIVLLHDKSRTDLVLGREELNKKNGEVTVKLQPCTTVTAQLVGGDGRPAAGVIEVAVIPAIRGQEEIRLIRLTTDKQGRFRHDLVPTGRALYVAAFNLRTQDGTQPRRSVLLTRELRAEPGKTIDLGPFFDVTTGKPVDGSKK